MKKIEDWTERAIEEASNYISENDITDEDFKQDLYVLALEYAKIKNAGKFKYSFVKYLERKESKKYLESHQEKEKEYIEINPCILDYDSKELDNNLLYAISTLTYREQKVLYYRFVCEMTLDEIGKIFCVNRERIRQIEQKALGKMHCPLRSKLIIEFEDIDFKDDTEFCYNFKEMILNYKEPYSKPSTIKVKKNLNQ